MEEIEVRERVAEDVNKASSLKTQFDAISNKIDDEYLIPLCAQRKDYMAKIKDLEVLLKHYKSELSQVDAEIEEILDSSGLEEKTIGGFKFKKQYQSFPKVTNPDKFLSWLIASKKYDILSASMIKRTATNDLIDSGVMPDGVDVQCFPKFKSYKVKEN